MVRRSSRHSPVSASKKTEIHANGASHPVCTENLNPEVVVVESAEDGARFYASGPLKRANSRRVFVQ